MIKMIKPECINFVKVRDAQENFIGFDEFGEDIIEVDDYGEKGEKCRKFNTNDVICVACPYYKTR